MKIVSVNSLVLAYPTSSPEAQALHKNRGVQKTESRKSRGAKRGEVLGVSRVSEKESESIVLGRRAPEHKLHRPKSERVSFIALLTTNVCDPGPRSLLSFNIL